MLITNQKIKTALAAATSMGALTIADAALAQSPVNPIAVCRAAYDDEASRNSCLESAITAILTTDQGRAAAAITLPAWAAGRGQLADVSPAAPETDIATGAEPDIKPAESIALEQPPASQEVASATSLFGAEQVERQKKKSGDTDKKEKKEKTKSIEAGVVEFAKTSIGDTLFILDNGQIWRKKRNEHLRGRLVGKRDYTVKISKSAISGYRMKIRELGESIAVERVK